MILAPKAIMDVAVVEGSDELLVGVCVHSEKMQLDYTLDLEDLTEFIDYLEKCASVIRQYEYQKD